MTWAAFQRGAYQAARSWGIQPSEFWKMPIADWWVELDAQLDQADRIKEITEGAKKPGGKFSGAEWADARKRFKERKAKNGGTKRA